MAGHRIRHMQVPDPADADAWDGFVHWLRGYRFEVDARGLHLKTIRGWDLVEPTDWIMRLPGLETYLMSDERWQARKAASPPGPK
jgi:hypothetical protein